MIDRGTWLMLIGAPLAVVLSLLLAHNVFLVFAVYHLSFCLLLPAFMNLVVKRQSLSQHLQALGLIGGDPARGMRWGLLLGGAGSLVLLVAFHFLGETFFRDNQVTETLAAWGVSPGQHLLVATILVLLNGPAEELFWRGFMLTRMGMTSNFKQSAVLTSLFYASYHGVTVFLFLQSIGLALLVMVGIFGAGFFWAHLRRLTDSIWPALISHSAITAAYVWIWFQI